MKTLHQRRINRGSQDNSHRLRKALDAGSGHIVVFGETPHEATVFVDTFLAHAPRYHVARASALRLQATDNIVTQLPPDVATVVVVHDAEAATASQLEKLRGICERDIKASSPRLRLVLIGAAGLERMLTQPEARALASRIGVRLRVAPGAAARELFSPRRPKPRRWPFVASAAAAGAAIVCMAYADLPATRPATRLAYRIADQAVVLRDRAVDIIAERVGGENPRRRAEAASAKTPPALVVTTGERSRAAAPAAPAAKKPPQATAPSTATVQPVEKKPEAIPPSSATPQSSPNVVAALPPDRAARAGGGTTDTAPRMEATSPAAADVHAPTAGPMASHPYLATVVSLFVPAEIGDRVIASGGALIESIVMIARLMALEDGPRGVNRPVQLGSFDRPQPAFALKSTLVRDFDRVAVARFDPPAGPFFSVRVFDAASKARAVASPVGTPDRDFAAAP